MDFDGQPTHSVPEPLEIVARISIHEHEFIKHQEKKLSIQYPRKLSIKPSVQKRHSLIQPDPEAPKDRYNFVLFTLIIFGCVRMIPIVFFFTANEYWMYKFRNTTSNSSDAANRTWLQINYSNINMMTVTYPGVVFNFLLAIFGHKIRPKIRILTTLVLQSAVFVIQNIFVFLDTDTWQIKFAVITMATQLVMSAGLSFGGAGTFGMISKLPYNYVKLFLLGEGFAELFTAVMRLISVIAAPSVIGGAIIYFTTGSALLITTGILFYIAMNTSFFRYYTERPNAEAERKHKIHGPKEIFYIVRLMWPLMLINVFPMLFPTSPIVQLVVSELNGSDKENLWSTKYFVTVCSYLVPAISGVIGKALFNYVDLDLSIPTLGIVSVLRVLCFTSLIYLSNAQPRHHLPVIINHDWMYALVMAGQQITTGFMMNLVILKSMRMVPPEKVELSMVVNMFWMTLILACTSSLGVVAVKLI